MLSFALTQNGFLVATLGVTLISLLALRRRLARRERGSFASSSRAAAHCENHSTHRDLHPGMLELHEVSRRVNAQSDLRLAKLEALIRQADERIASLQRIASERRTVQNGSEASASIQ